MMNKQILVSVYTQVYNTKPFLARCIGSVLNQTFKGFEYILIDNGSTDGSKEMLERFAEQDSRIRLIRFEENRRNAIWWQIAQETTESQYIAALDSDDWWEPDYLESLIGFLERNHLDLAVTGTVNYFEKTGASRIMRKLENPYVLNRRQFAERYPQLWTFPSTNWATIMRTELFRKTELSDVFAANLSNGGDTVSMLRYMKHCNRIGIDNTALYHYRIRPQQVSRQYNPKRFDSNVYYTNEIRDFLEYNHAFDVSKEEWLKLVYLNSITTTLGLLDEADLPQDEKMAECARIAAHPLTAVALTNVCPQREQWIQLIWTLISKAVRDEEFTDTVSLQTVVSAICPQCSSAMTVETLSLFLEDSAAKRKLMQDDLDGVADWLLDLIQAKRYTKRYDLGSILQRLAVNKVLLCNISDIVFMRKYRDIYWTVWQGALFDALEEMTGLLLGDQFSGAEETFLQLYVSVAAMLEQAPAFVFGKIKLARLYLYRRQLESCRAVMNELEEMGLGDDPELIELHEQLETIV